MTVHVSQPYSNTGSTVSLKNLKRCSRERGDFRCKGCVIQIRINDPRSLGSWYIKETEEALPRVDSLVPLMHYHLGDLWIVDPDLDHPKGMHPKFLAGGKCQCFPNRDVLVRGTYPSPKILEVGYSFQKTAMW